MEARILVEGIECAGAVEIHVKSSQWYEHGHQEDPAYQQVMLHVVWKENKKALDYHGRHIPTVEICDKLLPSVLLRHRRLFSNAAPIPCHNLLSKKQQELLHAMISHALKPRLQSKCQQVLDLLSLEENHWDVTLYKVLGRNFGFKINTEGFEHLVKLVPLTLVKKLWSKPLQLEALYFGQAGYLQEDIKDPYYQLLKREFAYLRHVFPKLSVPMERSRWKFLRLRPANFPTVRIAQFSQLMHKQGYRFGTVREIHSWGEIQSLLAVDCSPYWQHHYQFARKRRQQRSRLGKDSIINLVINSLIPIKMAYQLMLGRDGLEYAQNFLRLLPAENNRIIRYWKDKGFKVNSAYHSQGLLALYDGYCQRKKCMQCQIGTSLISG